MLVYCFYLRSRSKKSINLTPAFPTRMIYLLKIPIIHTFNGEDEKKRQGSFMFLCTFLSNVCIQTIVHTNTWSGSLVRTFLLHLVIGFSKRSPKKNHEPHLKTMEVEPTSSERDHKNQLILCH